MIAEKEPLPKSDSLLTDEPDSHLNQTSASAIPSEQSFMNILQHAGMKTQNTNSSQFDSIITNFVSKTVRRFCHNESAKGQLNPETGEFVLEELKPMALESFAAVVMVDVSGYSKLTAALAERGPVGAELLSKTMKGYLDQVNILTY
jgi:class 3 adenylate cyclase